MSGHRAPEDYDNRLMEYLISYTRENRVPPPLDLILKNVSGISSKSSLQKRLQKLEEAGLLRQKNDKGYYYPTSLEDKEVLVPLSMLTKVCEILIENPKNAVLVKQLSDLML